MYRSFEDLKVWQRGVDLAVAVFESLAGCQEYGLKDQMTRSGVSIASNIAEGAERNSDKDFQRFIHISKGSAAELRTQAIIDQRIGVLSADEGEMIINETRELGRMLQGLADSLNG